MKVHLHQIPQGDTLHIEGKEDASFLGLEEAKAEAASPLQYSLDVGVSGDGLFATGTLEILVKMQCVACLQEFEYPLRIELFAVQKELDGAELVDLTAEAREDIHLALPAYPRCDAGGQKCPASFPGTPGNVPTSETAWSALDKLKEDNH